MALVGAIRVDPFRDRDGGKLDSSNSRGDADFGDIDNRFNIFSISAAVFCEILVFVREKVVVGLLLPS